MALHSRNPGVVRSQSQSRSPKWHHKNIGATQESVPMAYTRSMGQQPWWFQLLAAGSDESGDEDYEPPVQQERLARQRAVEPVHTEATYESDTDESIDITHTSDESDSDSEHESDDDFIVYDHTP